MNEEQWPTEWLRGVLPVCVLAVVAAHGADGTYGYAIARRLAEGGLGRIKGGTLYPILNRSEEEGHLVSTWVAGDGGPGRKSFVITDAGRTYLDSRAQSWRAFVELAGDLMKDGSTR